MKNLIKNPQWFSQSDGKILYFTNLGNITYDKFCMDNHRFCSLSMQNGQASNSYDLCVDVCDAQSVRFGYHMRSIIPGNTTLQADFYDENDKRLNTYTKCVSDLVGVDFCDVSAVFPVPAQAAYVMLSLHFSGNVTATTFGMPFLELY